MGREVAAAVTGRRRKGRQRAKELGRQVARCKQELSIMKKEWNEADAPAEPEELVREAYRDGLTTHEDAVFGLNN